MSTSTFFASQNVADSAPSFLLDDFPGAECAYSMRLLRSAYTGPCVRVRRLSDQTESDIGFTPSGDFDKAAYDVFVPTGNAFVRTWYDQSGNGHDIEQPSTFIQPQLLEVDLHQSNRQAILFNLDYLFHDSINVAQPFVYIFVGSHTNATNNGIFVAGDNDDRPQILSDATGDFLTAFSSGNQFDISEVYDPPYNRLRITLLANGSSSRGIWLPAGGTEEDVTGTLNSDSITGLELGNADDGGQVALLGNFVETILYPSDISSDFSGIHTHIEDYWF